MIDYSYIGQRIRKIRKAMVMTQKEMATKLGVSASYINKLEKGNANAELNFIHKLSIVFRCDINWLLHGGKDQYIDI